MEKRKGGREGERNSGLTMVDHFASDFLSDFLRQKENKVIQAELA